MIVHLGVDVSFEVGDRYFILAPEASGGLANVRSFAGEKRRVEINIECCMVRVCPIGGV